MDYALYTYGVVAFGFIYAAIWTAGGQRARLVLTLGAYAYHPRYEPPSRTWRRNQSSLRGHVPPADGEPSWHQLIPAHEPADSTPTVPVVDSAGAVTTVLPRLVHAEQGADEYGAEHWGALLDLMNTEERLIYNAEIVETYEATKAVERPALSALDRAMDAFQTGMAEQEQREAAAFEGTWHNLYAAHGGRERWQTGAYALVPDPA